MKRRSFLKGLLGASAVVAVPAVAKMGGGSSNKFNVSIHSDENWGNVVHKYCNGAIFAGHFVTLDKNGGIRKAKDASQRLFGVALESSKPEEWHIGSAIKVAII